jgi:hypothetical protein
MRPNLNDVAQRQKREMKNPRDEIQFVLGPGGFSTFAFFNSNTVSSAIF